MKKKAVKKAAAKPEPALQESGCVATLSSPCQSDYSAGFEKGRQFANETSLEGQLKRQKEHLEFLEERLRDVANQQVKLTADRAATLSNIEALRAKIG